jgi:hypothetical protein
VRDFPKFLYETARSFSSPLLSLILADCIKLREWARDHGDYAASAMFDTAIDRLNAEIASRASNEKACGVG